MEELDKLSYQQRRDRECSIEALKGLHILRVEGLEPGSAEVRIFCSNGIVFGMAHQQDCCESVQVEDVVGDIADLVDADVIDAREETNSEADPADYTAKRAAEDPTWDRYRDSFTWTFYIIQTNKGAVTIRWLGESNGYYGEGVDFARIAP